jgi:hypothetical protein
MTDGSFSTGACTQDQIGEFAWMKADLGSSKCIESVAIAGGNLAGYANNIAQYFNTNAQRLEVSNDGSNWILIFPMGLIAISDTMSLRYSCGYIKARYVRVGKITGFGLTELRVFGF